jgi:ATP-dependent DNA helicase RecQ
LIQNNINATNINTWLKSETEIEPEPGIEARLQTIDIGDPLPGDIVVGFRNNRIWKITKYLQNKVEDGSGFTEAIVQSSCLFVKDPIQFVTNLIVKHQSLYNHLVDIPEEHHEILRQWFTEIRDESDTYKAIYRLSVIKVIDDYEIDYNKKCLYIKVNKRKSDDEYIENLRSYYLRYKSREEVNKRIINLANVSGNSIMQKCLADLTDFVYSAIADKRLEAIKSMEQACIRGIQDPEDMKRSIKTYFDSKYVDDIRKDSNDGIDSDPDVLWDYLKRTDGIVDNLEHLLGSSRRMLDDRPDNPVFILMQCFSIFLLYTRLEKNTLIIKNDELINSARKDFVKGINRFESLGEDTEQILTKFKQEILKHNRALDEFISSTEEEIWLKIHADWLDNFNKIFYDYERN